MIRLRAFGRGLRLWALPAVIAFVIGAVIVLFVRSFYGYSLIEGYHAADTASTRQQQSEIDALSQALSKANEKLTDADLTPVPVTVSGSGTPGQRGTPGKDGADGTDGANGVGTPGADGKDGSDGADGATGSPGADSTVPGVQGEQGVPGQPGKDGVDGAPGRDGAAGAPGVAGADGRSVTSVSCVADGLNTFIVFYDQNQAEIGRVSSMCSP